MKTAIVMLLLAITMVKTVPVQYYDKIFDTIDAEKMWANKDILKEYTDCFLDRAPCNEFGEKIKSIIPDGLQTACARCTDVHKHSSRRYFEELAKFYPEDVQNMLNKYDPEQKYTPIFLAAVKDI